MPSSSASSAAGERGAGREGEDAQADRMRHRAQRDQLLLEFQRHLGSCCGACRWKGGWPTRSCAATRASSSRSVSGWWRDRTWPSTPSSITRASLASCATRPTGAARSSSTSGTGIRTRSSRDCATRRSRPWRARRPGSTSATGGSRSPAARSSTSPATRSPTSCVASTRRARAWTGCRGSRRASMSRRATRSSGASPPCRRKGRGAPGLRRARRRAPVAHPGKGHAPGRRRSRGGVVGADGRARRSLPGAR